MAVSGNVTGLTTQGALRTACRSLHSCSRLLVSDAMVPPMSTFLKSLRICIAGFPMIVAAETPPPAELTPSIERVEQRFILFRPGAASPAAVPLTAQEKLRAVPPGVEVLHSRWAQINDLDPSSAAVGDRVLFEGFDGESFEVEISRVEEDYSHTVLTWAGRIPGRAEIALTAIFSRKGDPKRRLTLHSASLDIPGQWRRIAVEIAPDMPGWAVVKEIRPGTAPYLGNDQVGTDFTEAAQPENSDPAKH